jgi:hypothetical protein
VWAVETGTSAGSYVGTRAPGFRVTGPISGGTPFNPNCSQGATYVAAQTGLSTTESNAYKALVCGLVADGTFTVMKQLYVHANASLANGLVNAASPGTLNMTNHGTCTLTVDVGVAGDGSTCYNDPGANPTAIFTSALLNTYGVCIINNRTTASSAVAFGGRDSVPKAVYFQPYANSGGILSGGAINSSGGDYTTSTTGTAGAWTFGRINATSTVYLNGVALPTTSNTSPDGLPTQNVMEFALNTSGTISLYSAETIAYYWAADAGLTAGQVASIYTRFGTMLTALGVGGGCSNNFSSAAVYFDSVAGSDTNNCLTTGTPCQTVAKMKAGLYAGGATINWKAGSSFTGCLALSAANVHSTTALNPITIQPYSTGATPILNGNCGTGYGNKNAVLALDSINATVTGISVVGPGFATSGAIADFCIAAQNSSGVGAPTVIVENNTVTGCGTQIWTSGFGEVAGFPGTCGNITPSVLNNTLSSATQLSKNGTGQSGSGCGTAGNDTLTSQGNLYFFMGGDTTQPGAAQGNGAGYNGPTAGSVMQFELAHDNGGNTNACGGPFALWQASTAGTIQRFSEAYNQGNFTNSTNANCDGGGFDLDLSTSGDIVEYVYSHHNYGPGFLMFVSYTGNTFRYSISENDQWSLLNVNNSSNDGGGALSFNQTYSNFSVYNMTVFLSGTGSFAQNGPACWSVGGTLPSTGIIIENIACWNSSANSAGQTVMINGNHVTASGGSATPKNNDYYYPGAGTLIFAYEWNSTIYNTLALFQSGAGVEANSISTNPSTSTWAASGSCSWTPSTSVSWPPSGCPSTYSSVSSAIVGTGAVISSPGSRDYYGNAIGSPPNMGAYSGAASGSCSNSMNFAQACNSQYIAAFQ